MKVHTSKQELLLKRLLDLAGDADLLELALWHAARDCGGTPSVEAAVKAILELKARVEAGDLEVRQ